MYVSFKRGREGKGKKGRKLKFDVLESDWGEEETKEPILREWEDWDYSWTEEDWIEDTTPPLQESKAKRRRIEEEEGADDNAIKLPVAQGEGFEDVNEPDQARTTFSSPVCGGSSERKLEMDGEEVAAPDVQSRARRTLC